MVIPLVDHIVADNYGLFDYAVNQWQGALAFQTVHVI